MVSAVHHKIGFFHRWFNKKYEHEIILDVLLLIDGDENVVNLKVIIQSHKKRIYSIIKSV